MRARTSRETLLLVCADQFLLRTLSEGLELIGGYSCFRATSTVVAGEILGGAIFPDVVVADADALGGADIHGFIERLGGDMRLRNAAFVIVGTGHMPHLLPSGWIDRAEMIVMPAPMDEILSAVRRALNAVLPSQ